MHKLRLPLLAAVAMSAVTVLQGFTEVPAGEGLVRIDGAAVRYRASGEFLDGTTPVNGPIREIRQEDAISIMKRQVTRGEYDRCVAAAVCQPLDKGSPADRPAVGVSYDDAIAYAAWLSGETGEAWRPPTDREWALAAGSRYRDDAWTEISDPADPSKRWLATYDAESSGQEALEQDPQPVGAFGENEHGVQDLAGNVWEWTSTCFVRQRLDAGTAAENCGIRVAEGRHRAYMTGFFRDPKAGACSVGIPPANLGIRLVRDEGGWRNWLGF